MKKYDMSIIDLSEVINVTTDIEQLQNANERLKELGLLTEKGNVSAATVQRIIDRYAVPFFEKLQRRLARKPGFLEDIYDMFTSLIEREDFCGAYLYLTFWYGYLQWRVPEAIALAPADDRVLTCVAAALQKAFSKFMEETAEETE